jgi:hypothetical protein
LAAVVAVALERDMLLQALDQVVPVAVVAHMHT